MKVGRYVDGDVVILNPLCTNFNIECCDLGGKERESFPIVFF